jgi:DNA polymerase III delta prime subunit
MSLAYVIGKEIEITTRDALSDTRRTIKEKKSSNCLSPLLLVLPAAIIPYQGGLLVRL